MEGCPVEAIGNDGAQAQPVAAQSRQKQSQ
jgi:hypothetical protein